jgi:hypothetical protein
VSGAGARFKTVHSRYAEVEVAFRAGSPANAIACKLSARSS